MAELSGLQKVFSRRGNRRVMWKQRVCRSKSRVPGERKFGVSLMSMGERWPGRSAGEAPCGGDSLGEEPALGTQWACGHQYMDT